MNYGKEEGKWGKEERRGGKKGRKGGRLEDPGVMSVIPTLEGGRPGAQNPLWLSSRQPGLSETLFELG